MRASEVGEGEYNPYYKGYIAAAGDGNLLDLLKEGVASFIDFIESIPEDRLNYRYQDSKWTVAEVLVHLFDAERVFQYRALRFARNDNTPLTGFEQDDYVPASEASKRSKASLISEYQSIRESTLTLFETFDSEKLKRSGQASGSNMSVRALGFVIVGHQNHHQQILKERYLV
ncbi:DinB family protein [Croceivirga thetidis]|uniref:DinB family protein n=1 Tax=Croceivirga thetidis TaxID=2721623 RepID=A0ABX1GU17_9FLAO|nr:DinB family protein [Croceivirga thetidis]NKI32217.1 DinB family protein [Croceivirga thetidis]